MYRHRIRASRPENIQEKERQEDPHAAFLLPASDQNGDLLQLLALVVGDSALVALTDGKDEVVEKGVAIPLLAGLRDDIVPCLLDYQEELIIELLLRTAIKSRLRLDAWEQQRPTMNSGEKMPQPFTRVRVGDLQRGNQEWQPMPLREGCNKIIHADRFSFPMTKEGGFGPSLTGIIETEGKQGETPWCARLNVVSYVRASIYNCYGGFDFPRGWMRQR